jgi:hypothetical protein
MSANVSTTSGALEGHLADWVAAGLLTDDQSVAIVAHERAKATYRGPAPTSPPSPTPPSRRRVPVIAEALGYLGGVLALVGLVLVVARYWADITTSARLALSGAGALAFLGAGFLVRGDADAARGRLRGFLWLASTAASALFAGVLVADGMGTDSPATIVLACAGIVALQSAALWQWRVRPVQQLTCLVGLTVAAGALVAEFAETGPIGITVWTLGAVWVVAGLRRRVPLPELTEGVGAVALVVGSQIAANGWPAFGLLLGVSTGFGLLALGMVRGLAPGRFDQLLFAVLGGALLIVTTPPTLGWFSRDAGIVTGIAVWVVGAALVFVGARRLVRWSVAVETVGGIALIGGAALTGVESPGFATLFGLATAIGLLGVSLLPGQVLMSVFGSLGLLVNVPWALMWFFPGEGRAPLLVMVSGGLILAVAVLLAHMGGRFRREVAHPARS